MYYGLNWALLASYAEVLTPGVVVFGGGACGRRTHRGISSRVRRDQRVCSLALGPQREDTEKVTICKPERGSSPETKFELSAS